jgi:hypothetical protein
MLPQDDDYIRAANRKSGEFLFAAPRRLVGDCARRPYHARQTRAYMIAASCFVTSMTPFHWNL